jgi:hypothetical protein
MTNIRLLILISVLVLLLPFLAINFLEPQTYSAAGSIFGATGGILAVIWFTASLNYQARQLKEQRDQFLKSFSNLQENARRDALSFAKDILREAEKKAHDLNPNAKNFYEALAQYRNFSEWNNIFESTDLDLVRETTKDWAKKAGPAFIIMRGIKNAAEIYFKAMGKDDIDYSKEPDEFMKTYGSLLWNLPYFESYQFPATLLSGMMIMMDEGLIAIKLANYAVYSEVSNKEKIREEIEFYKKHGYRIPEIVKKIFEIENS